MAARAGALLRDLEFVQFHPTAIATGADPMPLATEALRGAGAVLVNEQGERFLADVPGRELAPRDVVARAIFAEVARPGGRVFLDARDALGARLCRPLPRRGSALPECRDRPRPSSRSRCARPRTTTWAGSRWMGAGAARVPGLWACGEVASTGLHGANRLASNSLLEALAYARWLADDIAGAPTHARPLTRSERPPTLMGSVGAEAVLRTASLRALMDRCVGVVRDDTGLREAVSGMAPSADGPALCESDRRLGGPAHCDGGFRPSGEPRGPLPQRPPEHDSRELIRKRRLRARLSEPRPSRARTLNRTAGRRSPDGRQSSARAAAAAPD